ncbi:MAG TPA: ELM1/GtrOC1 family putative glycosyltransferase [Verrucomicrobiae bacterium]|nr:ELM1/GtrOC1 family putative glycosyltransferase [Verrucomicrobiae bacterium]
MNSIAATPVLGTRSQTQARDMPILVRLEPRPGIAHSGKPPVRLFLGSEDAQYRAERIFLYALEQVRDPNRAYEIFVMRNMTGYTPRGWRTGFTNYRFAIPDYAGRSGKAIYNDVDQIYLADPGLMFDLDLGDHGFLAVSASDTSVMVMDCARMAVVWNLQAATTQSKERLHADAASFWGPLDPAWNSRDAEYEEGRSKLLHFTAMHTQPWQPFPENYAYRQNTLADIWFDLERRADAAGYHVFTSSDPSDGYAPALAARAHGEAKAPLSESLLQFIQADGVRGALVVTAGSPPPAPESPAMIAIDLSASGGIWPVGKTESVIAVDLLERLPPDDVPWTIDRLFDSAQQAVAARIDCRDGEEEQQDTRATIRSPEWWHVQFRAAAARHPGIAWYIEARTSADRAAVILNDGPRQFRAKPPNVWVLLGHRAGDRAQLLSLANALGWPFEAKEMVYTGRHYLPNLLQKESTLTLDPPSAAQLLAPWPDIVLDCGKRSVPVARWIKKQSGGRTRLVHLGRPWGAFDWFDLIVTTPQYRVPPRANVQVNAVPMNRPSQSVLDDGAAQWRERFSHLPRPWIGLIAGGRAAPYVFDAEAARQLGSLASAVAQKAGGSLLVTTSPRTGAAEAEALRDAISAPAFIHVWTPDAGENPYHAILALADELIVTGESASMLAEACSTGKPVGIFDMPRRPGALTRAIDVVERLAGGHGGRASYRGTPQQQDRFARFYDRLIEQGWFMPLRDFRAYQDSLIRRGWAYRLGEERQPRTREPQRDMENTVARIRRLLLSDGRRQ